ncbi:unknown [Ruminococcus sp. CAG:488]|nr:unknown [Ruminococcus sp. CAG:488]
MASYLGDIVNIRTRLCEQALTERHIVNAGNGEIPVESKIEHTVNIARIAVLNRQNGTVAVSVLNGFICAVKIGAGNGLAALKNSPRGDMGKCAFNSAVGNFHALKHPLLIFL